MQQYQGQTIDKFGNDTTGKIKYCFNQQGFRHRDNYTTAPSIAFFGCSLVFGVGVEQDQVFSNYFKNSYNYGLADLYNSQDIYKTIKAFVNSPLYDNTTIVVVWPDRSKENSKENQNLEQYYQNLKDLNIYHFFCGAKLQYPNCFKMIKDIDHDVSGTHPGPDTHHMFYKTLYALFINQKLK